MRDQLVKTLISIYDKEPFVFITGDVGYKTLDPLRNKLSTNFINAGISEQNMIGVASGIYKSGLKVFVHSIAPFVYARPFEQIRNNIAFTNLPICLIGNGGGYGYGVLGPSHHAIDDCAAMESIGIKVIIPCFDSDLETIIKKINKPTYLRLGFEAKMDDRYKIKKKYSSLRKLYDGNSNLVIFAVGPLVSFCINAALNIDSNLKPTIFSVSEYDCDAISEKKIPNLKNSKILVFEEHNYFGSFGMFLSYIFIKKNIKIKSFKHYCANNYLSGKYGSQTFHRNENNLDEKSIEKIINNEIK